MIQDYITTNVRLPRTLHKALKLRALEADTSLADIVRTILDVHVFKKNGSGLKAKTTGAVAHGHVAGLMDLPRFAQPMGGDLSSRIDEIVYG